MSLTVLRHSITGASSSSGSRIAPNTSIQPGFRKIALKRGSSRLGRWPAVVALLSLTLFARAALALGDSCSSSVVGFNMCNHQKGTPETLTYQRVWIVYWGKDWGNGINGFAFPRAVYTGDVITETEYINYLETFLETIGGTPYLDTQTQYGAGNPGANLPFGILMDHWFDPSPIPLTPSGDDIQGEVINAYAHFANEIGSNDQAIIVVALPPGRGDTSFVAKAGPRCGYHNHVNSVFGQANSTPAYYIVLPFQPDAPNCWSFSANPPPSDAVGHGILDGVSKVLGHEYAETITDPMGGSWFTLSGAETGDLCNSSVSNIGYSSFGSGFYWAAQLLWSNSAFTDAYVGCQLGDSPQVTANALLDFGSQTVISVTLPQTVFAGNSGTADFLNVSQPSAWELDDPTHSFLPLALPKCPKTLHPGQQCQIPIQFSPRDTGAAQATLYFNSVSGGKVQHVTTTILRGTGTPGTIVARGTNFLPTLIAPLCEGEGCHVVQIVELVNQDTSPHTIGSVSVNALAAADFTVVSDGCSGTKLQPGQSCAMGILFTPHLTGGSFGHLDLLDDTGTAHRVVLSGTGLGPAAQLTGTGLAGTGIAFPPGPLGTTQVQPITLIAGGQAPLTIKSITATGDFTETNNCPAVLALGSSCTINVALTPTQYQSQIGTLTINDDASDSPQTVRLTGTAIGSFALALPSRLSFGFEPVNIASKPLTVRLTALEGVGFQVFHISASGDFTETNDCPSSPSPLISFCTISVVFNPSTTGDRAGTLTIADDAGNGNQQIALSGSGVAFEPGGAFVIGGGSASLGSHVTFWGSQWPSANVLSGGAPPASFKGFEDGTANLGCGTLWTAGPGNSSKPPASVPAYMAVIVSSGISQLGSKEIGNTTRIAIVQTDPGYQPDPGHPGMGTVVGLACN
jgi:hypothetical protein